MKTGSAQAEQSNTGRRMRLPHPGPIAAVLAEEMFPRGDITVERCWAALERQLRASPRGRRAGRRRSIRSAHRLASASVRYHRRRLGMTSAG
jgi:hypothetical protein